jgi:hypothetical protein
MMTKAAYVTEVNFPWFVCVPQLFERWTCFPFRAGILIRRPVLDSGVLCLKDV